MINGVQKIDIADLRTNTDYTDITESTQTVKWFWEILGSLSDAELAEFLHFVTGSTKVPIGGFKHLYGSKGPMKFSLQLKKTQGLPTAHAWYYFLSDLTDLMSFNRLELNLYPNKEKLKYDLLYAIKETSGFGLQ